MIRKAATSELAALYESQGYYQDAHDVYQELHQRNPSGQTRAGIDRMKEKMQSQEILPQGYSDKKTNKISKLLEQWMDLIVLQHRLKKFKAIKSRFV